MFQYISVSEFIQEAPEIKFWTEFLAAETGVSAKRNQRLTESNWSHDEED